MRIVSLAPSFTETLLAMDAAGYIAGVTDQCPAVEAKRIGSSKSLRLEDIEALKPDFIFADPFENRPEQVRPLEKTGRVVSFPVRSVSDVRHFLSETGRILGKKEAAEDLIRALDAGLEGQKKKAAAPVKTVILLWNQPCITVNAQTYASSLALAAGARNLFGDDPVCELPIDFDDVVEKRPELLLLASGAFPFTEEDQKRFRGFPVFSSTAVELVDGLDLIRFGARTAGALQRISALTAQAGHKTPK